MMVKKGTATGLPWCLVLLVVACVLFGSAHALIHKLKIHDDLRGSFFIESFGFEAGGKLKMNFTNLKIEGGNKNLEEAKVGFIIKRTSVRYHGFIDEHMTPECLFDIQNRVREPFEETIIITDFEALQREITVRVDGTSFYNVYFVSCQKPGTLISFDLDMEMYNPVLDYLSTGDSVLPTLYTFFSFVYLLTAVWWIWFYMRPGEGRQIYRIHYLMTILLLLKMAAVFFHAVEMHYLKINGHPGAWSIVYFIFALMKGVMFFVVVGLIGSGWGFIKPFLSDKDKNVLLFVIPLQVVDNIALAIIEETAPGSFIWLTWVDIFRIVDIVCCVAVLAPIVWSVNHLKQASQVDGKATRNFTKLKLFQTFYLTVISFIYMTRIIVYLLDSSLNFRWTWMAVFVSEVSTLVFILCTGNMFKPVADNPFLKMDTERDVELNEFNDRDSSAEIHHPLDRDD